GAGLVQLGPEHETARLSVSEATAFPAYRPAGDHFGEGGDVFLCIASPDPEGMQLENLAREILVDPDAWGLPPRALRGRRIRPDREVVVEIQLHRRVRVDREQHVREAAEDVRPDRLALEAAGEPSEKLLVDGDGKVVAPELRQPLEEGTVGGNRVLQA